LPVNTQIRLSASEILLEQIVRCVKTKAKEMLIITYENSTPTTNSGSGILIPRKNGFLEKISICLCRRPPESAEHNIDTF